MIRIDVITGFLGAGKTTFLRRLIDLNVFGDEKVVIIENEFGEVAIDHMLLEDSRYKVIDVSGGCICCSLKVDLIEALISIYENEKPARVIIEPSGIFIVEDLFEILGNALLVEKYYLGGIYMMIDAAHCKIERLQYAPFFASQIKHAHHIILSKFNQFSDEVIDSIGQGLRLQNNTAMLHTIPMESWDQEMLLLLFSKKNETITDANKISEKVENHGLKVAIESVGINADKGFSAERFERLIVRLQSNEFGHLLRVKGFVEVDGVNYLFNYVQGETSFVRQDQWKKNPSVKNKSIKKLTFIGEKINRTALRKAFTTLAISKLK